MLKKTVFSHRGAGALCALLILLSFSSPALPGESPGARVIFEPSSFAFTEGAWAEYSVKNLAEETSQTFKISIHEQGKSRGKTARWIEVKMSPEGEPGAAVRFLSEETPSGPGEILRLIVQPEGSEPFNVPRMMLRGGGEQSPDFEAFDMPEAAGPENIKWRGKDIEVFRAEWVATDGTRSSAAISPAAAPLGIVFYKDSEAEMLLEDWGAGAETAIKGRPVSFFSWIMRRALKGN